MNDIRDHLAWWGLQRLTSDEAYDRWQRETLGPQDITCLHTLIEHKQRSGGADEAAFYDFTVRPHILPVLYSQRYEYYEAIGPRVLNRLKGGRTVLDFGCGPGILTTFYARQCPEIAIVGLDRSAVSVGVARERAIALGLKNVRFEAIDVETQAVTGRFDVVVCTHTLLQSETDPGIPSANWQTFDRSSDIRAQESFEQRTGLGVRLDALCDALAPHGRMILFEKTRQPARRVPFQRALAARGLGLLQKPEPVRYRLIEEIADDGPLYLARKGAADGRADGIPWDEEPECAQQDTLYRCAGRAAAWVRERLPARLTIQTESWPDVKRKRLNAERGRAAGTLAYLYLSEEVAPRALFVGAAAAIEALHPTSEAMAGLNGLGHAPADPDDLAALPLYENHTVAAQRIWSSLDDRRIIRETTLEGPEGRQMHVELGQASHLIYLYWANTFDQRQLVIVEQTRAHVLEQYYQEFLDGR